jgi:hypothetical protein
MSGGERRWKTVDLKSLRAKAKKASQHGSNEQHRANHTVTGGSESGQSKADHHLALHATAINQDSRGQAANQGPDTTHPQQPTHQQEQAELSNFHTLADCLREQQALFHEQPGRTRMP